MKSWSNFASDCAFEFFKSIKNHYQIAYTCSKNRNIKIFKNNTRTILILVLFSSVWKCPASLKKWAKSIENSRSYGTLKLTLYDIDKIMALETWNLNLTSVNLASTIARLKTKNWRHYYITTKLIQKRTHK